MPRIYKRCPKCNGCLTIEPGDYDVADTVHCINCGMRPRMIPLPQEPTMMKSGPVLANVIEVRP